MGYPEEIRFKDSVVSLILVEIIWVLAFVTFLRDYIETNENGWMLLITILLSIFFLILIIKPTVTTLSPDGVEVKAWGGTIFHKWSNLNGFRIYRQAGYMGIGRRYVTFQDETKRFQKHVFLVPISIFASPSEVLKIVESYKKAVFQSKSYD